MLELVRQAGVNRVLPGGLHAGQIGRMHRIRRPPLLQLLEGPTEVIEHLAVDVLDPAVSRHDRDQAGNGLDDEPEALFTGRQGVFGLRSRFGLG